MNHKLSSQAVGAIMMALQKSLIEQSDIVTTLQGFEIQVDDSGELVVMNPPLVKFNDEFEDNLQLSLDLNNEKSNPTVETK